MKSYEVLTIGYEGREIDDFVGRLKNHNVTRLVDVREIPLSRKKGYIVYAGSQKQCVKDETFLPLDCLSDIIS